MNEYSDFFVGLLIQIANFLKIKRHYSGWLLTMACIIYWCIRAGSNGFMSQAFWNVISFSMCFYGFMNWVKK